MKCLLAQVIFFFGFATLLLGQAAAGQVDRARVLLDSIFAEGHFPGLAVAVWQHGDYVLLEGWGYADLESRRPVDPQASLFRVGSISKPFTASGLALLHEAGALELDRPIQAYVPAFPEKRWPITLRQLAGHLAGIRHYRDMEFMSNVHYPTVAEGLSIFLADTLLFEPGTQYAYSSYGWNLISAAMESAAGQPFLPYMQAAVFDPLGMEHTQPEQAGEEAPGKVAFYMVQDSQFMPAPEVDNSYKWAGGGFISTAADVARFGAAHLSPGFLSAGSLWEWRQTQYTSAGQATRYGIGWRTDTDAAGRPYFGHSGGSVGGTSMLLIYPQYDLVVVTLANCSNVPVGRTAAELAAIFTE